MEPEFYTKENYIKLHQDRSWMNEAWNIKQMSAKEIADELHISVKLVHIWIKRHGL